MASAIKREEDHADDVADFPTQSIDQSARSSCNLPAIRTSGPQPGSSHVNPPHDPGYIK
jgi:hypothetical protein